MGPASQYGLPGPYPPSAGGIKGSPGSQNGEGKVMPDLPPYYFYPFYTDGANANGPQPNMTYQYQHGQDQFVLEEKDTTISPTVSTMQMQQWNGVRCFVL